MKYGFEDKSGLGLNRDVYAEQFADPGDIKTKYILTFCGDCLLESKDPQVLAKNIYKMIERLHTIRDHLRRIGRPRASSDEPSGDMD